MKRKHKKTLVKIFASPSPSNIKWQKVVGMLKELGATIDEKREGSRVLISMQDGRRVMHKPHPRPTLTKAQVETLRKWLERLGHTP